MGERPDSNRQELQSALDAVTTSLAVGRPVSPDTTPAPAAAPGPVDGKQELATAYDKLVEHEAAKPTALIPPPVPLWKRYRQPAIIVASLTVAIYLTVTEPAWLYPTFDPPEAPGTWPRTAPPGRVPTGPGPHLSGNGLALMRGGTSF